MQGRFSFSIFSQNFIGLIYFFSDKLKDTVEKIREFSGKEATSSNFAGPVETHPEYLVLVDANNLAAEIDEEISNIHRFAKDIYSKR